jgi:hypothetical protein
MLLTIFSEHNIKRKIFKEFGKRIKTAGERKASLVDSSAFAITHISHFVLAFINNRWSFLTIPAFIWMLSMFLVSVLFSFVKSIQVLF